MIRNTIRRRFCGLVAGAALSFLASTAANAAYFVTGAGVDATVGGLSGTVNYAPSRFSENASIGRIALTGTNSDTGAAFSFASYCVDIFDTLKTGTFTNAATTALNISATKLTQLNALLSNVDPYVTDATTSAAAQLAVWEIVNERSDTYSLTDGAFGVTNISRTATSDANRMLSAVTSGAWKATDGFEMTLLTGQNNQTQLVYGAGAKSIAAVPEAGTWAMMLVGFGAIGAATRRRRTNLAIA